MNVVDQFAAVKQHYDFTEEAMWAMPVRRLKRLHERIAVHRAQAQLDLLDVIIAPNLDENGYTRLRNSITRVINPMANKRIIKV